MKNYIRLNEVLLEKNIKRSELAEKMGVRVNHIHNLCLGYRLVSIPKLYEIADILNVDARELLISNNINNEQN